MAVENKFPTRNFLKERKKKTTRSPRDGGPDEKLPLMRSAQKSAAMSVVASRALVRSMACEEPFQSQLASYPKATGGKVHPCRGEFVVRDRVIDGSEP